MHGRARNLGLKAEYKEAAGVTSAKLHKMQWAARACTQDLVPIGLPSVWTSIFGG